MGLDTGPFKPFYSDLNLMMRFKSARAYQIYRVIRYFYPPFIPDLHNLADSRKLGRVVISWLGRPANIVAQLGLPSIDTNQPEFDGLTSQPRDVAHIEFAHNVVAVSLDRGFANAQNGSDFLR